jgi:hypothetical protein
LTSRAFEKNWNQVADFKKKCRDLTSRAFEKKRNQVPDFKKKCRDSVSRALEKISNRMSKCDFQDRQINSEPKKKCKFLISRFAFQGL